MHLPKSPAALVGMVLTDGCARQSVVQLCPSYSMILRPPCISSLII